jgi:hypothetical protein
LQFGRTVQPPIAHAQVEAIGAAQPRCTPELPNSLPDHGVDF